MLLEEDILEPGVTIVSPVYNSAETLEDLVEAVHQVMEKSSDPWEMILVNDGSADESWEKISELTDRYPRVKGICFMRNYGQHNALLAGIRIARYEVTVTIDDDLQHPPEEIPKLLEVLDDGIDVVYGYPEKETHGLLRNTASVVTKIVLQGAIGAETARRVSAFRALRTSLRSAFASSRGPYVNLDVLLTWGSSRFAAIPVRRDKRKAGVSNYTFRKLVRHAFNMMTGFSSLPLQFAILLGLVFTLFGIGILLYVMIGYYLHGTEAPGFSFLASIIAIFSGATLFSLGVIGEYIAQMHFRIMMKPVYTIRETAGDGKKVNE